MLDEPIITSGDNDNDYIIYVNFKPQDFFKYPPQANYNSLFRTLFMDKIKQIFLDASYDEKLIDKSIIKILDMHRESDHISLTVSFKIPEVVGNTNPKNPNVVVISGIKAPWSI